MHVGVTIIHIITVFYDVIVMVQGRSGPLAASRSLTLAHYCMAVVTTRHAALYYDQCKLGAQFIVTVCQ